VVTALDVSAQTMQSVAVRKINEGPRSGRTYYINGRNHQASAPGEPPKTITGALASSVFKRLDAPGLFSEVGTGLDYGKYLEFGTSRMAPRPWMQPSFGEVLPAAEDLMRKALGSALTESVNGLTPRSRSSPGSLTGFVVTRHSTHLSAAHAQHPHLQRSASTADISLREGQRDVATLRIFELQRSATHRPRPGSQPIRLSSRGHGNPSAGHGRTRSAGIKHHRLRRHAHQM